MGWWRIILLLITAFTIPVDSQFDSHGFLYINCGLPENTTYVDAETNLTAVSDSKYIDTGNITTIDPYDYYTNFGDKPTLRYFPIGTRNCYTIRSLTVGLNYLVRAEFWYGNYDNTYSTPSFDVYIGVNYWFTVRLDYPFIRYDDESEIILTSTADYLEVCLINTGKGTPFINHIKLRQLKKGMYSYVNSTQSAINVVRYNFGSYSISGIVRFPNDIYDRYWTNYNSDPLNISTNSAVAIDSEFETPSLVMQTALTTSSTKEPINFNLSVFSSTTIHYVILHFSEIQNTSQNETREFDIKFRRSIDDYAFIVTESFIPDWLSSKSIILDGFTGSGTGNYSIILNATSNSTLPPLLNAIEQYTVARFRFPTYPKDVAAINHIKEHYKINNARWRYDPCLPANCAWDGIKCNTDYPDATNYTRITSLSLSSSGLTGPLSDSIGNLSALVSLDLSVNDLSGSLPDSLDLLTNLTYLDIRGNMKLSTTLPPKLGRKYEDKKLSYRFDATKLSPPPKKKKAIIAIAVVFPLFILAVVVGAVLWLKRIYYGNHGRTWNAGGENYPEFEIRKFNYNDLRKITNGFKNSIGTGGFGTVYFGVLKDGVQVAVKMHSNSSSQGVKELVAEAESLTRVHHKNLVALMGYCIDKDCMALVYEYMQEGNLHDKLNDDEKPLPWKQRIQIAHESALGLEYLHKACNPPLIHRDVKTSNILLNASLQAKIADFGLSRTFNSIAVTHVSTKVVGTPGYLDPEYYLSHGQLSVKSDVYSFGVVLLEIITGRPPLMAGPDGETLIQWVRQQLSVGDIESIVDPKMQGRYDINAVWKVTNLACKCTEVTSSERPTMFEVASELKESLDLEISTEEMHDKSTDNLMTDVSQASAFEIAYEGDMSISSPSVR